MSSVRIEDKAFADARFAMLAKLMKLSEADHAIIKVARIWQMQTENYTPERPTYVVHQDIIEAVLGPKGADHLRLVGLAEDADGGLYMKGTRTRIEWLYNKRRAAAIGGEVRAANAARNGGRFTSDPPATAGDVLKQLTSGDTSGDTSGPPAETSPLYSSLFTQGSYEPSTLAPSPQGKRARAKPKKPLIPLPEAWQPTPAHAALASELGINLAAEAIRFRTDCEAKGRTYVNHDAAFSNWLRSPYQKASAAGNKQAAPARRFEDHDAIAEQRMAEYEAAQREAVQP